ncbi:hypothetical protein GRI69_14280 [Erythrobacter vulgaris]|uniref:Uncharacterized protein n=1 Tax=Qipengyuania vulgaris TaxID=291985 RepID=A0A844XUI1_9SPHN|nr:lysylphosphatidylglycerol synthase domain-containing protein [Qipengyuania vulgaris]MXO49420.1 hypothetical protein [Qipengyuania vulgaris]
MFALLITGLAIGFSGMFETAWHDLKGRTVPLSSNLVIAWLIFGIAVFVSGLLWGRLLGDLEQRSMPPLEAGAAHCVAWLLKYIPGQVGALVYKIAWGRTRGISATNVTLSFVYENIFLQLASLVPGLLILSAHENLAVGAWGDGRRTLLVAGTAAFAMLLAAVLLGPALRFGIARLEKYWGKKGEPLRLLRLSGSLRHGLWFVAPRLLNGAGFVLIVAAVAPVTPGDWAVLGAIYVVAGAIGILAVFVPSGLGVREGVIVVLASPIIGTSDAIFAAILARLIATAADALVALAAALALWQRPGEFSSSQRDAA